MDTTKANSLRLTISTESFRPLTGELVGLDECEPIEPISEPEIKPEFPSPDGGIGRVGPDPGMGAWSTTGKE
ncbi:hypothetical protein [Limnospira fusiformis]|uniref:hypothetical protein n=1 Tax=Limnospira fusiformis TaxID=54297 RepID=UPI003F68D25C